MNLNPNMRAALEVMVAANPPQALMRPGFLYLMHRPWLQDQAALKALIIQSNAVNDHRLASRPVLTILRGGANTPMSPSMGRLAVVQAWLDATYVWLVEVLHELPFLRPLFLTARVHVFCLFCKLLTIQHCCMYTCLPIPTCLGTHQG